MEIKAADVAKLRKMTGAGMMDCKKALTEAEGDFDRAQEIIREKGKLVAAKRADRQTTEGAVLAFANDNKTKAVITCLGCETDFVANTPEFQGLAESIAKAALAAFPENLEAMKAISLGEHTVDECVMQQTGKTGEKHALPFYARIEAPYVALYVHNNKKDAAIVGFNKVVTDELGKDIAMQITAMNPVSINRASCPAEVIEKEMTVYREKIRLEGKPENMVDRIAEGMLNKFFKEMTLEDQEFVKEGKVTVKDHMKSVDPEAKVVAFYRFSLRD